MLQAQVNTTTLKCQLRGDLLLFEYLPSCTKCSWCIFDQSGGEKACGNMMSAVNTQAISISGLNPNQYQLCVIDGDMLLTSWFRIP
ncbi:MAG: hypothetical protein ACRCYO_17200 [Bacteroidia bacterium]